jgi:fumarate hydratase class II
VGVRAAGQRLTWFAAPGTFRPWARQVDVDIGRLAGVLPRLLLWQGGTAVGTGLNRHPHSTVHSAIASAC